ncbi:MAG TPA: methyltransferase, partial [Nannocystaceae bacterium]|nr:methyltransferase [Nannocystaceae bacterium]
MALTKGHLSRLRRALRPHLARGWERAVFATPEQDGRRDERVSLGPGTEGPPGDAAIAALLADAEAAAQAGYVKQTIVVDPRRRVQVDARHGHAQVRTLDDAAAAKVMGGKERAFRPDESGALLRAIGIMNADGTISARHARKYKQISHLAELCRPTWERLTQARPGAPLRILDLACGNAYLSFVLAESLRLAGLDLRLHGVDVRADVVERSRQRAAELGHQGISFAVSTIAAAAADAPAALGGDADLNIGYGKASIAKVLNVNGQISYGGLSIAQAGDVQLDTKYSELKIDQAGALRIISRYDDIALGNIDYLRLQTKYADVRVQSAHSAFVTAQYTDLAVQS